MKILLICSAGMSTSLLVQRMREYVEKEKIEAEINASGSEGLEEIVPDYDVLLVGPQVRHRFTRFKEIADRFRKPIAVIDQKVYGLVDGGGAVEQAINLVGIEKCKEKES